MKIHMVKKGDTLYFIAQKYNVSLEELIQANPDIANPDEIDVGMKVKIPMPSTPAVEMMHHHTVQQGDTLWKLSKAWGIPLSEMIKANPQLKNPNVLLTGEVVHIPKPPAHGGEVMPQAAVAEPVPGMMPGKKNTAVMPEAVVLPEPPASPMPVPEHVSEIQKAPAAPIKEEVAPAPKQPYPEHKHPYPGQSYAYPEHTHPYPVQSHAYPEHTHPYPDQSHAYPEHKHPYPDQSHDPEHKHPYPDTFPHAGHHPLFAQFPMPAVEAAAPAAHHHKCHPADPGHMHQPAMHSPLFAQPMPSGYEYAAYGQAGHTGHGYNGMGDGMPSGVQGAAGAMYNPADVSGYGPKLEGYGDISQSGAAAPSGMSGYMPNYAAPVAGSFQTAYGMPHTQGGCGCGGGTMTLPAMGGYGWPYAGNMHGTSAYPWGLMMNPALGAPGTGDGYARVNDYSAQNAAENAGYPLPASLPPLPTYSSVPGGSIQGSSEQSQSSARGESPLNLHHVDESSSEAPAPSRKKRTGSAKSKRSTRKAKPQRKQNLPWIR